MCGFVGLFQNISSPSCDTNINSSLRLMSKKIESRGPDSYGSFVSEDNCFGFAHTRLSILELSNRASQPMFSNSKNFSIAFNGEISNHNTLRHDLSNSYSIEWRSGSYTETLLVALEHWGIQTTLSRIKGMFSFALWDLRSKTLTLARDRLGEKPLYYGFSGSLFLFGSNLQSLRSHPYFHNDISLEALASYFSTGYVPAPLSVYQGFYKLHAGHFITLNLTNISKRRFLTLDPLELEPSSEFVFFFSGVQYRNNSSCLIPFCFISAFI